MSIYHRTADVEFKIGDTDETIRVSGIRFELDDSSLFMADVIAAIRCREYIRKNEPQVGFHELHTIFVCHSPVEEI